MRPDLVEADGVGPEVAEEGSADFGVGLGLAEVLSRGGGGWGEGIEGTGGEGGLWEECTGKTRSKVRARSTNLRDEPRLGDRRGYLVGRAVTDREVTEGLGREKSASSPSAARGS